MNKRISQFLQHICGVDALRTTIKNQASEIASLKRMISELNEVVSHPVIADLIEKDKRIKAVLIEIEKQQVFRDALLREVCERLGHDLDKSIQRVKVQTKHLVPTNGGIIPPPSAPTTSRG